MAPESVPLFGIHTVPSSAASVGSDLSSHSVSWITFAPSGNGDSLCRTNAKSDHRHGKTSVTSCLTSTRNEGITNSRKKSREGCHRRDVIHRSIELSALWTSRAFPCWEHHLTRNLETRVKVASASTTSNLPEQLLLKSNSTSRRYR